jgi:glycosyltransferase involved in cell wall biosynthesis
MRRITIGIPVYAEPERLRATLASLRAHTPHAHTLLLLPDGPDVPTQKVLATLRDIPQLATTTPCGAAACFNRLVRAGDADVFILLESGAIVGLGWLEHLLIALDADPRHGVAGPSTNTAWNEQGVFRRSGGVLAEVARTAEEARQRFGQTWRTLEPLYSLADFCYAVRREVVAAIGGADEGYGVGPCWEMDYNIRAARAGWKGVWACAAYVYRSPLTARRRRDEALYFEVSKRRYQDKFCGARLRGEKKDYRPHCRGDACPNFAPVSLIPVQSALSLAQASTPQSFRDQTTNGEILRCAQNDNSIGDCESPSIVSLVGGRCNEPLVTCIMPTYNRRSFIPQAIRGFLRQEYHNSELVIVDDGADAIADCVRGYERVRYIRLDKKLTIGAKRNLACKQARGEIIIHWDDDDWYPSRRVGAQVRALQERGADLCGSSRVFYYDPMTDHAWEYHYRGPGPTWVAGNTLAYRRRIWERNMFPDLQIGEDSRFVWSQAGKSIVDLAEPTLCVATVHRTNTSRKETTGAYWREIPNGQVHALLGDERYLYRSAVLATDGESFPLVSCIMPTYNRRQFLSFTLRQFQAQDYPNKELVIVDDGSDPIGDLAGNLPGIHYLRLPARTSIGAKRNLACRHARGMIIAHWDDDDWYAPDRLRYQVMPIMAGAADLTGLENAFVLELPSGVFWRIQPELHARMFVGNVHGGTLVYRRALLNEGVHYPEVNLAEDAWLLQLALRKGKRLVRLSNPGVFVYVRHGKNAWRECTPGQFLDAAGWERLEHPLVIPPQVLETYKGLAQS